MLYRGNYLLALLGALSLSQGRLLEDWEIRRFKRQGLDAGPTRAPSKVVQLDIDETSPVQEVAVAIGLTRAPAIEFGEAPSTAKLAVTTTAAPAPGKPKPAAPTGPVIQCPSCPGGTARPTTPAPSTTTFPGILVGSPYPFALPPPDTPYFGSKWNGPWGLPLGHYQSFRGTGLYNPHYQYYPLSYFGSFMTPYRYGKSGK